MLKLNYIRKAEALRYMGIKGEASPENLTSLIDTCEKELLSVIRPRYHYEKFEITHSDNGIKVNNTSLTLTGNEISSHLKSCKEIIMLAATLSAGVDALIRRLEIQDMASALITDALASTAIEQICDMIDEEIAEDNKPLYLTTRFSPGYGDLPLDLQQAVLTVLSAQKKIGLCVTGSSILTPRKSVTAIVGLSEEKPRKEKGSCAICNLKDGCEFRKRGERCGF